MSKLTATDTLDQVESISLKTAGLSLLAIIGIVGLGMLGAIFANQSRQRAIIKQYTEETNELISKRQAIAKELFSQTFDECQKYLVDQQKTQQPGNYRYSSITCPSAIVQLQKLEANKLKDSSATAYVRVSGEKYELIEASGLYNEASMLGKFQSYGRFNSDVTTQADLVSYLQNHQPILMWQNFISYIEGKEVIVPVKIDDQVVGYIFRGVIER